MKTKKKEISETKSSLFKSVKLTKQSLRVKGGGVGRRVRGEGVKELRACM